MRCEGGVAPGFFRSLYAPIERASGDVAVQASSAAAVTRSRSESSSMLHPDRESENSRIGDRGILRGLGQDFYVAQQARRVLG
jgi:hypothetical protein